VSAFISLYLSWSLSSASVSFSLFSPIFSSFSDFLPLFMILQAVKFNPCRGEEDTAGCPLLNRGEQVDPSYAHPQYTALKASVIQPQSNELTRGPLALSSIGGVHSGARALHVLN
jgi:hypothetical protein